MAPVGTPKTSSRYALAARANARCAAAGEGAEGAALAAGATVPPPNDHRLEFTPTIGSHDQRHMTIVPY